MLVRKAVAAASITTLMTAGLGLATAAPASAAPSLTNQIRQDVGNLALLDDVDLVVVDLGGGQLVNIEVDNINVVALNNIVVQVLNNVNVNIQDINIDVDIEDNVLIIDVL
jgi:hypothetical protein